MVDWSLFTEHLLVLDVSHGLFFLNLVYLFLTALSLHCCAQAFSSCGKQGRLSSCDAQSSHCCGVQASVVMVLPAARGFFPDQGSDSCSLHWQADS